ncbi:hypothetical protein DAPPUDRAFT_331582 [Daphnia pulex]|uniref:BED-type domain-containing protein n=1 Tax=Daphnia pulex TaxID=6669 RepID=E9HMV4_DAPPU|nr:hypothetical protein DAPPUDRAFT_331582 [Daphnia pulex]|eukprot:EFX66942.1 hypothetical protein DAPPUDRAFT_331582 [Daphnia pulex]
MASVSSGGSLPDDNFSNDSIDFVLQDVQTENDADDFRSLMDEIGIVEGDHDEPNENLKSKVWQYFTTDRTSRSKATCKLCEKLIDRSGGSTTNMIRHLRNVHKKEPGCASGKKSSGQKRQQRVSTKENLRLDRLFAMLIIYYSNQLMKAAAFGNLTSSDYPCFGRSCKCHACFNDLKEV